jgi:hypothetical protein
MQARHLFLLHIWRLDLAIQPSITAIPREPKFLVISMLWVAN